MLHVQQPREGNRYPGHCRDQSSLLRVGKGETKLPSGCFNCNSPLNSSLVRGSDPNPIWCVLRGTQPQICTIPDPWEGSAAILQGPEQWLYLLHHIPAPLEPTQVPQVRGCWHRNNTWYLLSPLSGLFALVSLTPHLLRDRVIQSYKSKVL